MASGKHNYFYCLENIEEMSEMAKALSSPVRLEILKLLVKQSMTMSELSQELLVSLSSVSMHTKILLEVGLITVKPKPGMHGAQKVCGIRADQVMFDFFGTKNHKTLDMPPTVIEIPIGNYAKAEVTHPCGIVSSDDWVDIEDSQYCFYDPAHVHAQLIWFTSGFLEYHITNKSLQDREIKSLNVSFEVCAEAPGYNNVWPSDISVEINHIRLFTFRVDGDYGGHRGINNPLWWSDSNTQYGEMKSFSITSQGTYMNGKKVSDVCLESLNVQDNYYFSLRVGVDEESGCPGGMNLFGRKFGNYAQDIRVEIQYQ